MSIWREPRHVTQRDPSDPRQFSHCWAAVGAWLLDGATDGAAKVTAKEFAKMAGGGSGRRTGSGTQEDIVQGLNRYGVSSTIVRLGRTDASDRMSADRRAIWAIATDYDLWPTPKDCMNGVVGPDTNHEVGIIGGTPPRVMNPLCLDYQTVTLPVVLDAAFKYAKQQGHSRWIEVVRVYRQKPVDNVGDKVRIAELEDAVAERDEWIASARALFAEGMRLSVSK